MRSPKYDIAYFVSTGKAMVVSIRPVNAEITGSSPVGTAKHNWRGIQSMVTRNLQNENTALFQINLFTIQEVAGWTKVNAKTVYRWISDNKIPAIRLSNRTRLRAPYIFITSTSSTFFLFDAFVPRR